jgi:uncharacterized repeat protein (TIGR03803 family)
MKTYLKSLFLLPALTAALALCPAGPATAQTFTTLYAFTDAPGSTNSDGANPYAALILSGNTLYGTAAAGGTSAVGTIFALHTDGTGFANLYSFTGGVDGAANPFARVILSGDSLYGTAQSGMVFKLNTNGTGFATLHTFTDLLDSTNSDGSDPLGDLVLSGNTLYGTTYYGGTSGEGTVFALNTNGSGFTNLHSFLGASIDSGLPHAGLILSGNTLYGTASDADNLGMGAVFAVNTDGTGYTNLHSFRNNTNFDNGANPHGDLVLSGHTLYGTTVSGGANNAGTVFAVNTDGTGFTSLHSFAVLPDSTPYINGDGAFPQAGLILSGNTLYGTAQMGGSSGNGTVYALHTDGTGFTNLHSFTALSNITEGTNSDGADPYSGLILSGNTLYGTARDGGRSGFGTVFSLSLGSVSAPQLAIIHSGASVILTWATNATGFTLQATTNLVPSAVWSTVSPAPLVVNGQNTVTNPVSGTHKFYRLATP